MADRATLLPYQVVMGLVRKSYCRAISYEWQDAGGQWWRSYGNENWQFASNGQMERRHASINDVRIAEVERLIVWGYGPGPDDFPDIEALGL